MEHFSTCAAFTRHIYRTVKHHCFQALKSDPHKYEEQLITGRGSDISASNFEALFCYGQKEQTSGPSPKAARQLVVRDQEFKNSRNIFECKKQVHKHKLQLVYTY